MLYPNAFVRYESCACTRPLVPHPLYGRTQASGRSEAKSAHACVSSASIVRTSEPNEPNKFARSKPKCACVRVSSGGSGQTVEVNVTIPNGSDTNPRVCALVPALVANRPAGANGAHPNPVHAPVSSDFLPAPSRSQCRRCALKIARACVRWFRRSQKRSITAP